MDVVYALDRVTVAEVLEDIADPPSYSTVRTLLRRVRRVTPRRRRLA